MRLTLHFLADDGNMLDCACLAGITAFRHFRRPEVEVIGDEIITVGPSGPSSNNLIKSLIIASSLRTRSSSSRDPSYAVLLYFRFLS